MARKGFRVKSVRRAFKVLQVHRVQQALMVWTELPARKVHKDSRVTRALLEQPDHKVRRVFKALQVQMA
jgi:hypothetical protein